jgi:ABC-type antimicrobial peptide transport system permease subunit
MKLKKENLSKEFNMQPYQIATAFIFFSGILTGMGILFGIVAAVIFYFEDKL